LIQISLAFEFEFLEPNLVSPSHGSGDGSPLDPRTFSCISGPILWESPRHGSGDGSPPWEDCIISSTRIVVFVVILLVSSGPHYCCMIVRPFHKLGYIPSPHELFYFVF